MSELDPIHEAYRARLELDDCYTSLSPATQGNLEYEIRRYGLRPFDKVAHGVLVFCMADDKPTCAPWLVAPDEEEKGLTGGRHSLVMDEFYGVADRAQLASYTKGAQRSLDYDDFVRTYVVRDDSNDTPFTVLCGDYATDELTDDQVELIKDFSRIHEDHTVLTSVEGTGNQRSYLRIREGESTKLSYGFMRGLEMATIADPGDIISKSRELENYARYALEHGLDEWEFGSLADKAVQSFHDGRQVSLDVLCQEVLARRNEQQTD